MRKLVVLSLIFMLMMSLSSCQSNEIVYTDDDPFVIEMKGESLKVLQLTDLHLTYGNDYRDRQTFDLIKELNDQDDYDLIVISGDMAMSPGGPRLFSKLIDVMESLKTPWTFIFGNHETDFNTYQDYLKRIPNDTEYLYFKVGPELESGGVGNFHITMTKDGIPFYRIYLLDSKAERDNYTEEEGEYDYLSLDQVVWYEEHVSQDTVRSMIFMHIPLRQYIEADNYDGYFLEDKVYAQGVDTGFFNMMVQYAKTDAVFVGHDHLNDFIFYKDGIMLAYGRATGLNGYGYLEKGGRHIEVKTNGDYVTRVITGSED